jgi:predicted DNA-binding ribbon-helix-helix protein
LSGQIGGCVQRKRQQEGEKAPVDDLRLTLKRYAGATAPVRFTFIEDQERSICAVDGDVPMGGRRVIKSTIVKRTIVIAGHKTSVSLEDEFWNALKVIAGKRDMRAWELVTSINSDRRHDNLSSAIRLFVLNYYQSAVSDEARCAAPNGNHGTLARGEA